MRCIAIALVAFFAVTSHSSGATMTISVAGDPTLKVMTDLPQNNALVGQILSGVNAARQYLGKSTPQEIGIYQDRATLLSASKMTEPQWGNGSRWAVTAGPASYFYAPIMTSQVVRVGAR